MAAKPESGQLHGLWKFFSSISAWKCTCCGAESYGFPDPREEDHLNTCGLGGLANASIDP